MHLFKSYFTNTQIILLVFALFTLLYSLVFHVKGKWKLSLIFLLFTALFVFCFSALLDPFLNLWDERFHALVAKNLMNHPLMPTLYDDPVVKMAYDRWDRYHIWLHKQPLFLWQIALSFKLFGISEFTLRLPNILLGVILVLISYRSGTLLFNRRVGYLTGIFIISTIYILELIGGRQGQDHNDFAFLVYISLSIWSFIEYYYSKKKIWILLIGIFSGMAILCKWLVGLLIYFGWFILKLQQKKYKLSDNNDLLLAFAFTLLIALPWQIFTFICYPTEAVLAYKFNIIHFSTALEGHDGTLWYHFEIFNTIYGAIASFLIVPAFYIMYRKSRDKQLFYTLLSMVLIVYILFSFASTKVSAFTIVVSMIIFIAYASLFNTMFTYIEQLNFKKVFLNYMFIFSIIIIILLRLDIEFLQERHTLWKGDNSYTRMLSNNREVFKSLKLPSNTVLFNVKGRHYIEAMFYTGFPSYNFIPSKEQYDDLKLKKRTIAIFKLIRSELPDYLKNDSTLIILNTELQGYE
jgi:4-amino-4-deoxy-L-arabinose transferase-like glycosyltransferase